MSESLLLRGTLRGHNGWVTQVATNPKYPDMILSSSRDRSLILWKLVRDEANFGIPQKRLQGHSHFVSDVVISSDGHFALSGSWDKTLRLWDLSKGVSTRQFVDHTKDVLTVAFSADNRQIVSGSRDKSIKLWNTLAQCKYTMQAPISGSQEEGHTDWVSCVRFSPNLQNPIIVSCAWDKRVKVWSLANCKIKADHMGHTGYLNSVTISPDGSLCASGGKDWTVMLWDLNEEKHLYTLEHKSIINALCFSPNRYWLCAATGPSIKIWDLEGKLLVDELCPEVVSQYSGIDTEPPQCLSLAWSGDGQTLFAGYSDNNIRAWQDVLSVAFSVDNRQIVSGSRDKTIKLWNTLAECKYTIQDDGHSDWVSCVRFSPNHSNPIIVSAGWDKMVKVWNLANCRLKINHIGHTGYLNTVTVSPDGSLCASGGKDCKAMLWDLNDGKHLHTLDHNDIITALCFSPNRYWLCAAFGPSIKIWDLESKDMVEELRPEVVSQTAKAEPPQCLSLAWSTDGQTLFAGYSDNLIRVWQVSVSAR